MIAIVGPTGVGKSDLALYLAQFFPVEVVSADSRQVYCYMDIGTNKPSPAEMASVPHHLVDVVEPDEHFSLAMYQQLAAQALTHVRHKGKLPLLVGGSGLYVWSLVEGWQIPQVPPDQELRRQLEVRAEQEGSHSLYRELQDIDPVAAAKINVRNVRRIIRALEIYHATKQPPSQSQYKETPKFPVLTIGLTQQRDELYGRIDRRVDEMIQRGLIQETEQLLRKGYGQSLPSMSGIGYKEMVQFLQDKMTLPEATDKIKHETHRLVRRQYGWFRLGDSRIRWFDTTGTKQKLRIAVLDKVKDLVEDFLD
jgi:tRNA dimethylallyltransferase